MNLKKLHDLTPADRHPEIGVSGEMVFFDNAEYVIGGDGELRLVRSLKALEQRIDPA